MITKELLRAGVLRYAENEPTDFNLIWDFLEHVYNLKDENDEKEIVEKSASLYREMLNDHGKIPDYLYKSNIPDTTKFIYIGILGLVAREISREKHKVRSFLALLVSCFTKNQTHKVYILKRM